MKIFPVRFFKRFILFFSLFISVNASAQITFDPDSILVGDRKLPEVLLVGTFHFAYYNLDAHKTSSDQQVDILSPGVQEQVNDLVEYIYKFRPNKVAVESDWNTGYLMQRYRKYLDGTRPLGKDETEQIGFRVMQHFGLDTIYGVNANTLSHDLYNNNYDSLILWPILDSIYADWDFQSNDTISQLYSLYYKYDDEITLQYPLLDYFKFLNSDKVLNRGFGYYLIGDFELGDYRGADALSMHWYNRNLRIYRNIQKITTSPDDRILVIYGAGHVQILKHLFECSPQYKLVKFGELE